MSTAAQAIQTQAPAQPEWNPVQELRSRYPGVANESDEKIVEHLSKPENFRSAFPEYAHVDDATIGRNMGRYGKKPQATTADNPVENARPSTLSRVGWEAAALPARVAGVNVEPNAGGNWLANMARMAGQVMNPARVGAPGFVKDIVHQMDDTSREGMTIAKTGRSVEPAAANETGAFQTRPGGPVQKLGGELEHPMAAGLVRAAASAVPMVGPAAVKVGHNMATGAQDPISNAFDAATVAGQAVTMANPELVEKATGPVTRPTAALVRKFTRPVGEVASNLVSRLRVPEAQKALTEAIQPGVRIPKAQESIAIAGPRIQQIRQAQGVTIPEKGPEALRAVLDLNREAKGQILSAIEDRVGPVAELRPDGRSVGKAIRASVDDITLERAPGAKQAVADAAKTYEEGGWTIRQMEGRMHTLNNQLGRIYTQVTPGETGLNAHAEIALAEAKALRTLIDESVEKLSGDGVKELKREYGAQRDVEKSLARQYAVATRVKGAPLWEGLAYLHAAGEIVSGGLWGAAKAAATLAVGKRMQLLRDSGYLANQAFHGSKAFEAAEPIAPHVGPPAPKGLLRDTNEHGLPEVSSNPVPDTSGPARGGRWTTPKAALPDEKPQMAKFLRVINKNPPRSPLGLLRESNTPSTNVPPMVDEKFAREGTRPPQGNEQWAPDRQVGTVGRGGIRTTPKAALPGTSTEAARSLVQQTLDMLRSGDRPGRYYDENEMGEYNPQKEQSSSRGVTSGGKWRGVSSMRTMLPWLQETDFAPAELERALSVFEKTGKMNSVMRSAAEFVEREAKEKTATPEQGEREPGEEERNPQNPLGMPDDLYNDIQLLEEERQYTRARTTPGAKVVLNDGTDGRVVEGAKDPVNGRGKDGMVLVEHEMEGRTVQRWYDASKVHPKPASVRKIREEKPPF